MRTRAPTRSRTQSPAHERRVLGFSDQRDMTRSSARASRRAYGYCIATNTRERVGDRPVHEEQPDRRLMKITGSHG